MIGFRAEKDAWELTAITAIVSGYGGDMDFFNNKVNCRKIEGMIPKLMKMVET